MKQKILTLKEIHESCFAFDKNPQVLGITWKNETSYRKDQERIPTIFSTYIANIRITIVYGHLYCKEEFILSCEILGFKVHELGRVTAKEAAEKALILVKNKIDSLHHHFSKIQTNDPN